LRFFILIAVAIAYCANNSAYADDEFSSARINPGLTTKWQDVQSRMTEETAHLVACRVDPQLCGPEAIRIAGILEAAREHHGRARVGHINRAINLSIRPISDARRFGVSDHWATPIETLNSGGGDCEDYAILKFLVLREAGLDHADLKLLIVRRPISSSVHAVLAVRIEGDWLILDNLGFALVRLEDSRYRVLAQLIADPAVARPAIARPDFPELLPLL
jgi:predicted transglutaminase-like cysteine proteinase